MPINLQDDQQILCSCQYVRVGDFKNLVEHHNLKTLEQTREKTGVAHSCGLCWEDVEELLENLVAQSPK